MPAGVAIDGLQLRLPDPEAGTGADAAV